MRKEIDRQQGKDPRHSPEERKHAGEQRIRVYIKIKPDGNTTVTSSLATRTDACLTFKGSAISLLHVPKRQQEKPFPGKTSSGDSTSPQSVLPSSPSSPIERCPNIFELTCDGIITPEANQEEVYSKIGISTECIDSCIYQGKSCLFVAYGPSGTGKSYTMFGDLEKSLPTVTNTSNNPCEKQGIVIQSIQSIFKKIDTRNSDALCIYLGAVEIYNEKVIDLQQKQRVESFADSMAILTNCLRQRSVCSTGLNNQSSRSHCIITLTIQNNEFSSGNRRSGTICFVDLAGSERCSKANTSGKQLLEGCAINKSLLTLGQVISSLQSNADIQQTSSLQKDTKRHVPWRQSKLTLILKEVLENSCSSCFVLCVSSRKEEGAETLSTLQFGSQLMNVRIRVSSDNSSPKTLATHPSSKKTEIATQNCTTGLQSGLYHKGTFVPHVPLLRMLIFLVLLILFIVQCLVVFL